MKVTGRQIIKITLALAALLVFVSGAAKADSIRAASTQVSNNSFNSLVCDQTTSNCNSVQPSSGIQATFLFYNTLGFEPTGSQGETRDGLATVPTEIGTYRGLLFRLSDKDVTSTPGTVPAAEPSKLSLLGLGLLSVGIMFGLRRPRVIR
jgi:hypothetical protein